MIKEPSETPLPTPLLVSDGIPVEPGSPDNSEQDLIVFSGNQISAENSEIVYTITDRCGSGNFGKVYDVERQDSAEETHFAMKISKSTRISMDQFNYEMQALSFVCI